MAAETLAADAILLTRTESGEHGWLLVFISPDHGLLRAFKRNSTKARQPAPDLFDEVALVLEKSRTGGDLWFVSEYRVRRRRTGLGSNYDTLSYACRYALILAHHLFGPEEAPHWTDQFTRALDAWETAPRPESTYFKALYLFARSQGIPIKEEWIAALPTPKVTHVRAILRQPLAHQTTPLSAVHQLIADLEHHLESHHDVRFAPEHETQR